MRSGKDNIQRKEHISEDFFRGKVTDIAEELIGKLLFNEELGVSGIVVETEAYLGREDPASHLVKAGEKRKKVFNRGAGTLYVFKIYQHNNFNFITEHNGVPEGILIRAVEPVEGLKKMRKKRGVDSKKELCSGPGKLTEAFGIKKEKHTNQKISESSISVFETDLEPEVEKSCRIGISEAQDWPLRFTAKDSDYISKSVETETCSLDFEELYSR